MKRTERLVRAKQDYKCNCCGDIILKGTKYWYKSYEDSILGEWYHSIKKEGLGLQGFGYSYLGLKFCSQGCLNRLYLVKDDRPEFLKKEIERLRDEAIINRELVIAVGMVDWRTEEKELERMKK